MIARPTGWVFAAFVELCRADRSFHWRALRASDVCRVRVSRGGPRVRLPSDWQTIAVPAFKNDTTRYRIEQRMTEAVIREFIQRTKYHIVQDPESADAVLHGEVLSIETAPVLFNATTGEVTTMLVTVHTKVQLVDNKTQKAVYHMDDMVFRQEYQISTDVQSFFEEQDPAHRADVARFRGKTRFERGREFLTCSYAKHRKAG